MSSGKIRAVQVQRTGGPEVLEYDEIDAPEPGSGEVAIEIGAAGVNFIDIYHRQGVYPMPLPFVPGREGAGRVVALGADVSEVAVGDRVAWLQVPRSYAEVTVVLDDGRRLCSGSVTALGDPEQPLSTEAVSTKFLSFATPVLGSAAAEQLLAQLGSAQNGSLGALLDQLQVPV